MIGGAQPQGVTQGSMPAGTSSTIVLEENRRRHSCLFINDSDTIIYITKGNPAVLNQGIRLNPNGGSYEDLMCGWDGSIYKGQYSAICSAANKTLLVSEYAS